MNVPNRTRVLLIDRGDCPDNEVCPAVVEIKGLAGHKGLVTRYVVDVTDIDDDRYPPMLAIDDPDLRKEMRPHVGPGEVGSIVPDSFLARVQADEGLAQTLVVGVARDRTGPQHRMVTGGTGSGKSAPLTSLGAGEAR